MGSGKTTLGKRVAHRLGYPFVDLDQAIEKEQGISVSEIFSTYGEDAFRAMETNLLSEVIGENPNQVISCGGGTPCFNNNMELMKSNGKTIYLQLSPEVICSRLKEKKHTRPLIMDKPEEELLAYIKVSLAEREHWYLNSDIILNAFGVTAEEVIEHLN